MSTIINTENSIEALIENIIATGNPQEIIIPLESEHFH